MIERDAEDITIAEGLPPAFSSTKGVHSLHKRALPLSMLSLRASVHNLHVAHGYTLASYGRIAIFCQTFNE